MNDEQVNTRLLKLLETPRVHVIEYTDSQERQHFVTLFTNKITRIDNTATALKIYTEDGGEPLLITKPEDIKAARRELRAYVSDVAPTK